MWLRRLVGVVMIITCVGMNALVLIGFFAPDKTKKLDVSSAQSATTIPTVSVTAQPDAIAAGGFSALSWTASGSPASCTASDSWSGAKTPFGAESTGRISTPGQYKYTLSCTNSGGTGTATVTVAVGPANAAPPSTPAGNKGGSSTGPAAATYCGGRVPCYNASDVSKHGASGNCWGWLGDRVINISGFDVSFHAARSGVSTIQVSGVCGKDISAAVGGKVSTSDYPGGHDHQLGAKSSSDPNYLGYFVGYFDSSKP